MKFWTEQLEEDHRKIQNNFTTMEAVIRCYSSLPDWKKIEEKYDGLKTKVIVHTRMDPEKKELQKLANFIKEYLKWTVQKISVLQDLQKETKIVQNKRDLENATRKE